jgi:hemerythrin HHE cation binding domain-containing protein
MPGPYADTREYLVVHRSLRLVLDRFVEATGRIEPAQLAAVLGPRWALFERGLHHHHEMEDSTFFPLIVQASPDISALVERLEEEHRELVARLDAAGDAVRALEADPNPATRQTVHDAIVAIRDQLVPHLDVEDNELLPPAAASVSNDMWKRVSVQAMRSLPRQDLPIIAGLLDEVVHSLPKEQWPPPPPLPIRLLVALSWRRRYARFIEPLVAS